MPIIQLSTVRKNPLGILVGELILFVTCTLIGKDWRYPTHGYGHMIGLFKSGF